MGRHRQHQPGRVDGAGEVGHALRTEPDAPVDAHSVHAGGGAACRTCSRDAGRAFRTTGAVGQPRTTRIAGAVAGTGCGRVAVPLTRSDRPLILGFRLGLGGAFVEA